MMRNLRRLILVCLIVVFLPNVWANSDADVKKRVTAINQSIAKSEQLIEQMKRFSATGNATRIEAELKKIEAMKQERQSLLPTLREAHDDQLARAVAEQVNKTQRQLTQSLVALREITEGSTRSAANTMEQASLRKMQKAYLAVLTRRMLGGPNESHAAEIGKVGSEGSRELVAAKTALMNEVDATWDGVSSADMISRRARTEAQYRIARLKKEAALMARFTMEKGAGDTTTVTHIRALMETIGTSDPNNFVAPRDGFKHETHKWFRELKREIDLEEFRRMAAHGPMFDNEKLIIGKTRQEIAFYSELGLAQRVKAAANTMPISRIFWPTDTRVALADQIKKEAMSNPDHVIFAYLQTGVEPSPRMYMFAVMRALRFEQEKINTWMVNAYGQDWHNTGLGTVIRANDMIGTGEAGFTEVTRRIGVFSKEVDAIHDTFQRATKTAEPEKLAQDDQDLLAAFGYIGKSLDGSLEYKVPKEGTIRGLTASAQRGLKLPGAAVLDVVTIKNVGITVISTVIPGGFATMIEGMAIRAGAGAYSIMGVKFIAEMGMSFTLDAGIQYLEKGKVDAEAILLDSLLLGGVLEGSNRLSSGAATQLARQMAKYKAESVLGNIMRDEQMQKKAASWLAATFSLSSEAAITTLYEEKFKGNEVDFNIFLSNLVNSAITREVSHRHQALIEGNLITKEPFNEYVKREIHWLSDLVKKDTKLANELHRISSTQYQMQQESLNRYNEAVGEGTPSADRLFHALLRGEISWMDVTIAYQRDTKEMKPLMVGLKELRDNFFDKIQADAVRLVRDDFRSDLRERLREIDTIDGITSDERDALKKAAFDGFLHDLKYFTREIINPGSKSPVSDIDRSAQHPRLRRMMERMFENRAREANRGGLLPTSARAFDVNEYYNVMPFISETNQFREVIDVLAADGAITHGDVMESFGYAAAMMHMNSYQKPKYKRNERKLLELKMIAEGLNPDMAKWQGNLAKFEKLFDMAHTDLSKGRGEVYQKMKEMGLPVGEAESEIRARSALYQKRIEAYYGKLKELDLLIRNGTEAQQHAKRAEIERDMAYMLREGIETYSGSATLDIIVSQMQIAGLGMEQAFVDPNFTLNGSLGNLKSEHIDFMLRDQCLMMVEHVNGYYHGHELPYNAGKALAKYAQRALLAKKIKGDLDLRTIIASKNMQDPVYALYKYTERLMANKANPESFNSVLKAIPPGGSPDEGLLRLMEAIENVIPEMKGMAEADNFQDLSGLRPEMQNPFTHRNFFKVVRLTREREVDALRKEIGELGGGLVLKEHLLAEQVEAERALASVLERLEAYEGMGLQYHIEDWPEVFRLKKAIHGCKLISGYAAGSSPKMSQQIIEPSHKMQARLNELMVPKQEQTAPSGFSMHTRLWLQSQHLEETLKEIKELLVKAEQQIEQEAKYEGMDLSGKWSFNHGSQRGVVKIQQNGGALKMWFTHDASSAKPPHFYAEAAFKRGRIHGIWEELHTKKLKLEGKAPAKDWKELGLLFGEVAVDRSSIAFNTQSSELGQRQEGGWRWSGLTLKPASDDTVAPTNLEVLSVKTTSIPQKQIYAPDIGEPRRAQGMLYIAKSKADGDPSYSSYALYSAGTYGTPKADKVAHVRANSEHSMVPGIYELIVKKGEAVERFPVTIGVGQTTRITLPSTGQIRFQQLDPSGNRFIQDQIQLRLFKSGKPVSWVSYTPSQIDPGSYEAVVYHNHSPIGSGGSYSRTIEVAEKKETLVSARYGAYQAKLIDAEGKNYADGAYLTGRFINPDGTDGANVSGDLKLAVPMLPGKYRVECRLKNSNTLRKEISILPAEVVIDELKLGRLKVLNNNRPISVASGVRVIVNSKTSKRDYVMVGDDTTKIDLFPDVYEVTLIDDSGRTNTQEVKVSSGSTSTIKFKL